MLLKAFDKALVAALAQPALLDQFGLADWERTLALEDPRIPASPVSRLDAFFDPEDGRLRFTEYNAETPAGSAYNDALAAAFPRHPRRRGRSFPHIRCPGRYRRDTAWVIPCLRRGGRSRDRGVPPA